MRQILENGFEKLGLKVIDSQISQLEEYAKLLENKDVIIEPEKEITDSYLEYMQKLNFCILDDQLQEMGEGQKIPTGSVIKDKDLAIQRVVRMVKEGKVTSINGNDIAIKADSVCVHGDNPKALEFVKSGYIRLHRLHRLHFSAHPALSARKLKCGTAHLSAAVRLSAQDVLSATVWS